MNAIFKLIAIYILRIIMRFLYVFPIKKNRIIFNAYKGTQYSGNPKYLCEYLISKYPQRYDIIWAFRKPDKFSYLHNEGITLVRYDSIKRFYLEATAAISINNVGSYSWLPRRKGQEHVNTWHGGFGVKKCGLDEIANNKIIKKTIQMSSDCTTVMVSTSREFDQDIAIKDLGFKGKPLKIGYPRNDILFKQRNKSIDLRKKVCQFFDIDTNSFILLYAPTWRYNRKERWNSIDYNKLKDLLQNKTKKNVVILCRMHHLMQTDMGDSGVTIDATLYPDMQELLAVADSLISDYSSCIWDYSIMNKPIYLYVPDVEEYDRERGSHICIYEWGFPVCRNNRELFEAISDMTSIKGEQAATAFQQRYGTYEKGNACEEFWRIILMNDTER